MNDPDLKLEGYIACCKYYNRRNIPICKYPHGDDCPFPDKGSKIFCDNTFVLDWIDYIKYREHVKIHTKRKK